MSVRFLLFIVIAEALINRFRCPGLQMTLFLNFSITFFWKHPCVLYSENITYLVSELGHKHTTNTTTKTQLKSLFVEHAVMLNIIMSGKTNTFCEFESNLPAHTIENAPDTLSVRPTNVSWAPNSNFCLGPTILMTFTPHNHLFAIMLRMAHHIIVIWCERALFV